MPRGKNTVYTAQCSVCNMHVGNVRIKKAKKADFRQLEKFCSSCRKKEPMKLKEEKHQ